MKATHLLAVNEGDIKHRVKRVAETHLPFVEVEVMPDDLKPLLASIMQRLTRKEPTYDGESRIQATMYRTGS